MATQKFSDLTAVTTPNAESVFAIAHSGSNFKLTITDLAANLPATTTTSLTTSGNATIGGDLTITGDDLTMGTNTSGAALIADGTNFNPVVISGDISIGTTGTAAIGSGVIIDADVNASAALAFSKMANLTVSRALVSDGSGDVSVSAVTSTEVGYLDGVSSAIQTQLDSKAASNYVPTTITVADESSDTTCFPLFTTAATGDLGPKSASGLTFNASTDVLSGTFAGNITGNVTGNTSGSSGSCTGNSATATSAATLTTARNIGGVSFNGSANIDLPGVNTAGSQNTSGTAAGLSATLAVASGGTGATSLTANGALIGNGTGAVTSVDMSTKGKLLAGDGSGNPSALSVGTNTHVLTADSSEATGLKWAAVTAATPTTITVADESTDTTCFPLFVTAATGDLAPKSGTNLAFNSSSGVLTATGFAGNITGDLTGTASAIADTTVTSAKLSGALVTPSSLDVNGNELILDADADTSITADTDDQIDFKIAGVEHISLTNSSGDTVIKPRVDAKDIIFQQFDGTSILEINDGAYAKFTAAAVNPEATLTDEATITWNSLTQSVAKVTLGANRTMGLASGGVTGAFISLLVIQDGTGSRTITWNAAYEFTGDAAPTLTATANKGDLFVFRYNGAKWLETGRNLNLTLS